MKIDLYLKFKTNPGQNLNIVCENENITNLSKGVSTVMKYHNHEYWKYPIELADSSNNNGIKLNYFYQFFDGKGNINEDWGVNRNLFLNELADGLTIIDSWTDMGLIENAYYTAPFREVFQKSHEVVPVTQVQTGFIRFSVMSPLLDSGEELCLSGNQTCIGKWQLSDVLTMQFDGGKWFVDIKNDQLERSFEYKYCIRNRTNGNIRFENGENRKVNLPSTSLSAILLQDNYVRDDRRWKGTGVAIPVFSIRTKDGLGVGEFPDIKKMVDWAKRVSIKMIQLLPVNDTTSTHSRLDSYPYAAISAFALHPLYISLEAIAGEKYRKAINTHLQKKKSLNELEGVDYEVVMELKWDALTILFELMKDKVFKEPLYNDFFNENKDWLVPYAAYSYLRDKFGSPDSSTWGDYAEYNEKSIQKLCSPTSKQYDRIAIHFFIQYHLHLQLKDAHDYANSNGIILKGDIAIGVHRHGADTWTDPSLYHLDRQAGAPPDDFAVAGQNWGFPTYNWEKMKSDGFAWWKSRFSQMSNYFDAFRIDHILGFFRIWSIPEHAVEGIMGKFVPSLPIYKNELEQKGIWLEESRLTTPFITTDIIHQLAPGFESDVLAFLDAKTDHSFQFKKEFSTQKQIDTYFKNLPETEQYNLLKQVLFNLLSNQILWKDDVADQYHFRFNASKTLSFQHLDSNIQFQLQELYNDYFFNRQEKIWREEAIDKLPALKKCTEMLVCGEDLGMVPKSVPEIMSYLGFLSMEVQRMPKQSSLKFFDPSTANYLSVVTPSTHDMSTIREWWQEDKWASQVFYNQMLWQYGSAPEEANSHLVRSIILQHLSSPAMWSIFQIQDLFAMNNELRITNPYDERINIPGDPKHYWRFRMHKNLEDLLENASFNEDLKYCITSSGR
jgi:4-alpha-glucanotransferase